ncbi:hypothetical protein ACRWY9_26640 [Escherichia coli]
MNKTKGCLIANFATVPTFVTSHITFGAEIVNAVLINKVLIAFALFGHRLVIKAGGDGVRDKTAVIVVCPARGFVE